MGVMVKGPQTFAPTFSFWLLTDLKLLGMFWIYTCLTPTYLAHFTRSEFSEDEMHTFSYNLALCPTLHYFHTFYSKFIIMIRNQIRFLGYFSTQH